MKKMLVLSQCLLFVILTFGQNFVSNESEKYPLIKVKDWGERAMMMTESGWLENKDEIVKQVGEKQYEEIRKNYDWKSIPQEMTIFDGTRKKNKEEVYKKLDSLKVIYKILTYDYKFEGKVLGKRVILKIPYKGNEDWDKKVKWNTIYVLIKENATEEIR